MAAIDQPVFRRVLLDMSLGIGENLKRLADQRPALVAGNMRQRIAFRRRDGNRGRGHTLPRHGNCSGWSPFDRDCVATEDSERARTVIGLSRTSKYPLCPSSA